MTASCEQVRGLAPELALGLVGGPERAELLAHLDGCADCRHEVATLAETADALLLVLPAVEPPPGFEGRVLERVGTAPIRRVGRRRVLAAAAAVILAVLGVGLGLLVGGGDDGGSRRLQLTAASGDVVGEVVLTDDPARMVCVFDDPRVQGAYRIVVVDESGAVVLDASVDVPARRPWSWTANLPVAPDRVTRIEVRSPDGVVRATT